MSENNEENDRPPIIQPQHRQHQESTLILIVIKVVVVAMFMLPLAHYSIFQKAENQDNNATSEENDNSSTQHDDELEKSPVLIEKIVNKQPSCPLSDSSLILDEICVDLFKKNEECTPEDVHNVEKHRIVRPKRSARNSTTSTTGDPRGTIVGCVAAGLLLTSLGAAVVELYKAKTGQAPVKNKPPMSRKCSLADLTVLKHNRKELVRRESLLEIPETGNQNVQLGALRSPPPLYRRSSFPVGPYEFEPESRRTSVDSRRLSIIDSRRNSTEYGRRISIDNESPDRRHWTRLVHRH